MVDVTDDNGATWVTWRTPTSATAAGAKMQFDIGAYVDLTSQVRFRFVASDEDPGSLVEAGVDDFSLVGCEERRATPRRRR